MTYNLDPQLIPWEATDGQEAGAQRAQPLQGPLVALPFKTNAYWYEVVNTGTMTPTTIIVTGNPDGSGSQISLGGGINGADSGARLWIPFVGRCFGVRWQQTNLTPNFDVVVDGVAVNVEGQHGVLLREGMSATAIADARRQLVTHTDLHPGQHYAEIVVAAETGGTAKPLSLYGYLVDRNAGYVEEYRPSHVVSTAALTTSMVQVPMITGSASAIERTLRGVDRIIYTNITAGAITVELENGSGVLMWTASIPANSSVVLDLGGVNLNSSVFKHKASAGSSVNATVIGRS